QVRDVRPFDLITVPAWTWHQFRANAGEPLGFLCMVNAERDRPQLPDAEAMAELRAQPEVAAFLAS
ncbi:MAG TPA: cupin domain-containing protein, partial [Acetobacteraceae bacterium]|nr:cupin domain-containing protein [Acetobacteraceae bacterium]